VVVVGAILRIGAETFEVGGEVRIGRRHNRKRVLALAFVLVFVNRAHNRGQDTRVPSAARSAKAETRAGETQTGGDTARGEERLFLAEWERLLLLLVISILLVLLVLL